MPCWESYISQKNYQNVLCKLEQMIQKIQTIDADPAEDARL